MSKATAPIPPILIMHGPERFTGMDLTDKLRAKLAKVHGEVQTFVFDGATASPAEILDELRSMGLMAVQKLVIVDNADRLLAGGDEEDAAPAAPASSRRRGGGKSARELFEAYAASPEPTAVLVMRADKWKSGKFDLAVVASGGEIIDCKAMGDDAAASWVVKRSRAQHGVAMEPEAAALVVQHVGTDLARLDGEAAKLAVAALGSGAESITPELVHEMTGVSRDVDIWKSQTRLMQADPEAVLRFIKEQIEVARENPVAIGIVLLDLARKLDGVTRGLAAGENPMALSGRYKLFGAMQNEITSAARRLKPAQTAELLRHATETDARNKSGRGDPLHNVEAMAMRLVAVMA